jgi:hypothetical protein
VNRELAQFAEAYDDVKGHPCTSKPASPIVRAQQKNTANDCEKLSHLDPNPIRRVMVTEVNNKTADTHGKIKAAIRITGTGILLRTIRLLIVSGVFWFIGI